MKETRNSSRDWTQLSRFIAELGILPSEHMLERPKRPKLRKSCYNLLSSSSKVPFFQHSSTQPTLTRCGIFTPGFSPRDFRRDDMSAEDKVSGSTITCVVPELFNELAVSAPANRAVLRAKWMRWSSFLSSREAGSSS